MRRVGKFLVFVAFVAVFFGSSQNVSAINIDNCSVLDTQGETYILTQDIINSPNTTCMNVTADDVTLDCNNSRIDGVYSASTYGVYWKGNDNVTVRNCNITDWGDGINMNLSFYSTVFKNNLSGNSDGVEMTNSWNANVSNNFIDNVNNGIYLSNSSWNSIGYNNIRGNGQGISLHSVSNNSKIFRNVLEYLSGEAIYSLQSYGNMFMDSVINSSNTNIFHQSSTDTTFLNVSLDSTKITLIAGTVYVKWYVDVRVVGDGGSPLNQANVTGKDKDNVMAFSELTNSSGYIERQNVTEFHHNFTGQFSHNSYSINTTKSGYFPNYTYLEVTGNKALNIYISEVGPPVVDLKTYDLGLAEKDMFKPGNTVRIRASVTYGYGKEYLSNATVLIKNNLGSTVVNNALMTNTTGITNGYIYEYNYTLPDNADGLWSINVTATTYPGTKGHDYKKIAVVMLTLQVKLILNSTSDTIYIPGTGERSFAGLTTNEYSTPDHYYIASYSNNVLKSTVFSYMSPISVFTEKGSSIYGIGTSQMFSNSIVFVVFSQGNWRNVNNRISSIESGEFLTSSKPSFGFGLGGKYPLKLILEYDNININKTLTLGRGYNKIVIEKTGVSQGQANIDIGRF